jgi:dipeptidyl-peptidase 4
MSFKMKRLSLVFILFLLITQVWAQSKEFTIRDIVQNRRANFYPQNISGVSWLPSGKSYSKLVDYKQIIKVDVKTGKEETVADMAEINRALNAKNYQVLEYISQYKWLTDNMLFIDNQSFVFIYNLNLKTITSYVSTDKNAQNTDFCPENKKFAYTIENNLFIVDSTAKAIAITNDKVKTIVNGQTVSRNEFGISKGTFWSPKGNLLAFYRKDESEVADYPMVDITKRSAELDMIKYPMAGLKSEKVAVGVYDLKTGKTIFIEDDKTSEKYLTNLAWSPDEKFIYIAVLNREQNHSKLNVYDASTGSYVKTLFEEKNDKYVEPLNPVRFLKTNPNQFIWETPQVDGFNHAFLYGTDGKLIRQLTKGDWMITEILGFDARENFMYFMATKENAIEMHLYKLDMKKGTITKLTSAAGVHSVVLSQDANYFVDNYSSTSIARKIDLVDNNGKILKNILTAENPMNKYKPVDFKIGTLKSADGKTDLYYRLIKPMDFDSTKKYPCIVYVYGGPHAQLITNSWNGGADLWDFYMAQKGYVVFTVDNRGSANRGLAFENIIHRQSGIPNMEDQMEGIKFLKALGYVNMDKIGVHGWSYGGYMTTSLMLNYPETFKVGVAGGAVIDWKYYEIMYGERYMDMPQENPDGYEKTCLTNKVKNLKGKLLEIHGYIDATVVPQHTLEFVLRCAENNIPVDYFPYPRSEHGVRGVNPRIHLYEKITQYFDDYLK